MAENGFDLAIIGAGPGGYVAAIRAAQLGMKAVIIEREHLGGICLNWGCIPTKALLRSAEIYRNMQHAEEFGLSAGETGFDLQKIVKRSRKVSGKLADGVKYLLKKNGVKVIEGEAEIASPGKITVAGDTVSAKNIIIATGARARTLPGIEPDGEYIWTYKHALAPKAMPKSLLVIGSGAIGIEFASFYSTLGAEVTVVEVMDRILPIEDAEISSMAGKSLTKQGMKIFTGSKVESLQLNYGIIDAEIVHGDGKRTNLQTERAIVAAGIVANVENLGLERIGVLMDKGHIATDEWCATNISGIYAIGDVAAPPWLAHKASHEAVICVEKIAGLEGVHPLDYGKIPGCTYCNPQIASVGYTEETAKAAGFTIKVGRFPYQANGKAIALGDTEGMIKTILDAKTGELLGAHMIGAEVTELIQGFAVAMNAEVSEVELMQTIFPHPTLSEMMHESILDAFDRAIHI
jgi:dihydrolipoamide dehydrogenase